MLQTLRPFAEGTPSDDAMSGFWQPRSEIHLGTAAMGSQGFRALLPPWLGICVSRQAKLLTILLTFNANNSVVVINSDHTPLVVGIHLHRARIKVSYCFH